jgi:hypothetical protein
MNPQKVAEMRRQLIAFALKKPQAAQAEAVPAAAQTAFAAETVAKPHAVVIPYKKTAPRAQAKAHLRAPVRAARSRQSIAAVR